MHHRASHGTGAAPHRLALALMLAAAATACEQVDVVTVDVASIQVEPAAFTIEPGESRQLAATLTAEDGQQVGSRAVQWSSSDPTVALVREDGRVTAVGTGSARITASVAGVEGSADVTVRPSASADTEPAAPTELRAVARKEDRIDLAWRDNSDNENRFVLQRARNASGTWTFERELSANTTSHSDRGLDEETRYWYRVLACNAVGCSASAVVSEQTRDD